MARISAEHKRLRDALNATTDPALVAELTAQLNALLSRDERRKWRAKRKAEKAAAQAAKAQLPQLSDEELTQDFEFVEPAPAVLIDNPPLATPEAETELPRRQVARRQPQTPNNGSTRVIPCMAAPWEQFPQTSIGMGSLEDIIFAPPPRAKSYSFHDGEFDVVRERERLLAEREYFNHPYFGR